MREDYKSFRDFCSLTFRLLQGTLTKPLHLSVLLERRCENKSGHGKFFCNQLQAEKKVGTRAAYHLTQELRSETSERFEWRKIITFRYILIHDYYQIELPIVWKTIEDKLPNLKVELKKLLQELEE